MSTMSDGIKQICLYFLKEEEEENEKFMNQKNPNLLCII